MSHLSHPDDGPGAGVKVVHLVFGLLFVGASLLWLLGNRGALDGGQLVVAVPLLLIVAGIGGLAATMIAGFRRTRLERLEPDTGLHDSNPNTEPTQEIR